MPDFFASSAEPVAITDKRIGDPTTAIAAADAAILGRWTAYLTQAVTHGIGSARH